MIEAAGAKLWWNFRKGGTLWSEFLMNKYCRVTHPVVRGWQYKDSHIWRRMVEVREKVEPEIEWKIGEGNLNLWWDNWSGKGAVVDLLNLRGKRRSKEVLKEAWENGNLILSKFGIQRHDLAENIVIREGQPDKIIWKPTRGEFTLKSAKAKMRQQNSPQPVGLWCKKVWCKGVPWKMSFLAWRVFRKKMPMDDVLRRMGYSTVSKCSCCVSPGCETIQHVFGMGDTAKQVWDYFAKSMGTEIQVRSERHVCYEWWNLKFKNRMMKYITERLPTLILWELWVNFTQCKFGREKTSVKRIIYKVTRDVVDCIQRKWPSWDPLPPNCNFIIKKAEGFGCGRIVQKSCWCRPLPGSVKINWTVGRDGLSCGFFGRNSKGMFCVAGVT